MEEATKKNANVIRIDDGTQELTLANNYGQEICKLHIRLSDLSILDRLEAMNAKVPEIVKPLEDIDINPDGTARVEDKWGQIKTVEANMLECLSEVFDTDEIKQVFKKRFMFSSVGGQFFVITVLNALTERMTKMIEEETEMSVKRMDKYLKPTSGGGKRARKPA